MDMAVHAVTLGFMFNVIFGVDAVLLYGHAGIPFDKAPRPSPIPGLLLNSALILRAIHGFTGLAPRLAALSGPLAGLGILFFYGRNIAKLRRLLRGGVYTRGPSSPRTSGDGGVQVAGG